MRGVLAGVASTMGTEWRMEYLTHSVGSDAGAYTIIRFGGRAATPWQFPNVWFYFFAGYRTLRRLVRHGHHYALLLPQDGVFTGALTALAGRRAGIPVICMDHGTVTLPFSRRYRQERVRELRSQPPLVRLLSRLRYALYWPSLRYMARLAARHTDLFLVPGDESVAAYREHLSVDPARIVRYRYIIDTERFAPLEGAARAAARAHLGVAPEAILVTLVNRLAPEKGMGTALEGIRAAFAAWPADVYARVRVIFAGDGPLRASLEGHIALSGLGASCSLLGEIAPTQVATLLGVSDLFLYTGTRGANYSLAVLEAMSAGCLVIASSEPQTNVKLLADGRGFIVPAGDGAALGQALAAAARDLAGCRAMGRRAREYVIAYHGSAAFRQVIAHALQAVARRR